MSVFNAIVHYLHDEFEFYNCQLKEIYYLKVKLQKILHNSTSKSNALLNITNTRVGLKKILHNLSDKLHFQI